MRQKKKNKISKLKKIFIAGILVILVILLFLLVRLGIFNIKYVNVNLLDLSCVSKPQILNSLQIKGRNFFLLNSQSVVNTITSKFICVEKVALAKKFPDQVTINVYNRQPKAELLTLINKESSASSLLENSATPSAQQLQDTYLVDNQGIIFFKGANNEDIPKIYTYDLSQGIGQRMAGDYAKNIFTILDKVKVFGLETKTSVIVNNYYVIFSSPKVIFRLDNSIDIQIASLQLILEKAKIDLKSMEFIDLRYDKPVVKYTPKKNG